MNHPKVAQEVSAAFHFAMMVVLMFVVGTLSMHHLGMHPARESSVRPAGAPWFEAFDRWDAGWYCTIAEKGYDFVDLENKRPTHFFPLYPLLIRWISFPFGGGRTRYLAGMFITLVAGLAGTVLFVRLARRYFPALSVRAATCLLLTYPFAFFLFGAVYSDALFFALALASFSLLDGEHPVAAGFVGALATATRPIGPALIVGLLVHAAERRGGVGKLRPRDAGVLLSPLGMAAYCAYLWAHFGSPLHFIITGADWGAAAGPATWFKVLAFHQLLDPKWAALTVLHLVSALWCFALVPPVLRSMGRGYAVYALLAVGIAFMGTADLIGGMGRYTLAAFPCFFVAGDKLAATRWRHLVFAGGAVGLCVLFSFFARWYFVS